MSTEFWIQASNPRWSGPASSEDSTLDEAIETVFPRETEDAFLVWRHVYVPLSYKYDVGTILLDVLRMIELLVSTADGKWQVEWPSNTFAARWELGWQGERLVVTATEWRSIVGDTEEILRNRSVLQIGRSEFVCEWKALLQRAQDALQGAGYTSDMLPDLDRLVRTTKKIVNVGVLYR